MKQRFVTTIVYDRGEKVLNAFIKASSELVAMKQGLIGSGLIDEYHFKTIHSFRKTHTLNEFICQHYPRITCYRAVIFPPGF